MATSILDMQRTLINKLGFIQSNRHHFFYTLFDERDKPIVITKLSHQSSGDDISKPIFSAIARQIKLTTPQLKDAVNCPLSRKDYSDILKEKGIINSDLP